jgi:hypothetical protein
MQTLETLKSKAAEYIARNGRRFPNGGAALNVISQALETWHRETSGDTEKLVKYFDKRPSGKFDLPFLN